MNKVSLTDKHGRISENDMVRITYGIHKNMEGILICIEPKYAVVYIESRGEMLVVLHDQLEKVF